MSKPNKSKNIKKNAEQARKVKQSTLIYCAVIVVIIITVYSPLFNATFLHWDDDVMVTENYVIKNPTTENIKEIFSRPFLGSYNPLVVLTFAAEEKVFGLNASAFHITNLAIHILNSLLVFWLVVLLCRNKVISLFTALLFSVHPMHVEAVAWVTALKETLFVLFYLSSVVAYIYFVKSDSNKSGKEKIILYLVSIVLFIFSVLSKPVAVTLPAVLILIDYFMSGKFEKKSLLNKIPFIIISIGFSYLTFVTFAKNNALVLQYNLFQSVLIFFYSLVFYLYKLVFPVYLAPIYPFPSLSGSWMPWAYMLSPIIIIALLYLVFKAAKRNKDVVFAAAFFLITILPVSNFIPVKNVSLFFDRFTYLPYIGLFYLICSWLYGLYSKGTIKGSDVKTPIVTFLIVVMALLCYLSFSRAGIWKNGISLWTDAVDNFPDNAMVYWCRGEAFFNEGNEASATNDYNKAVKLDSTDANFYSDRAKNYAEQHEYDKAASDYNRALQLKPDGWMIYNNMGLLYAYQNKYNEALQSFNKSLELNPDYALAVSNKGNVLYEMQNFDSSITVYSKAIEMDKYFPTAYVGRGLDYYKKKMYPNAIDDFLTALRMDPDNQEIYQKITYNYFLTKDYNNAWKYLNIMRSKNFAIDKNFLEQLQQESGRKF